jgi:hypothetical protein
VTEPGRGRRGRLGVALALLIVGGAAKASTRTTTIAIVAPQSCPPDLRERIAEQIGDLADDVGWACLSQIDEEEPFRGAAPARNVLEFWIDLTPSTEARILLHDGLSDRFVVRRVPLPRGLDEIGREEIGQILRSALLAVRAGPDETLNRSEARAEVARWAQPRSTPPPATPAPTPAPGGAERTKGRPLALEIAAFGAARAFASPVPVVGEVGVAVDVGRWGPLAGWLEGAGQLPADYRGSPVGVALRALSLRAGLDVSGPLGAALRGRLGLGAGLTRMAFTPEADGATATAAPPDAFVYATGRMLAGLDARLGAHAVTGLTLFLDLVAANVHYDLREADGTARRVMTPYRFQPGVSLRMGWSR